MPLLADIPGAKELTLSAATRYSDFDSFGDTTNSKFGLKWRPLEPLLARASWAEGFRAPDVSNLYGGASQTFSNYNDPGDTQFGDAAGNARCLEGVSVGFRQPANDPNGSADSPSAQTPIPFVSGPNEALTPQTSEFRTLGIFYNPFYAQALNQSLDCWMTRIENTIITDNQTQVLNDCHLRGIESRCDAHVDSRLERDATTGQIISFIATPINAGFVEIDGFDFAVDCKVETRLGDFNASWLSTYVSKLGLKVDGQAENPIQPQNVFDCNSRIRSNLNLGWERGPWGASWAPGSTRGLRSAALSTPLQL